MEYSEELIENFLSFIEKETSMTDVCEELGMKPLEVLGLVNYIKEHGVNIAIKNGFEDIYMVNMGDVEFHEKNTYQFATDEGNEFKFIAIADTRLGSKYEQLSILNDIYIKGHEMGFDKVFLCGNISSGLFSLTDVNAETNFCDDTQSQIDYIVSNYPYIEGMKTYFITGKLDDQHLKQKKINIGKRISEAREDMVYIGDNSCDVIIDKTIMQIMSCKLGKTYTASYRTQQQIDSYRSEDKPDVLVYGGLLQMEKYTYRNVKVVSVPSVCATTKDMTEKRYANTIGAWYVTVRTDAKGKLLSVNALCSPYYVTNKDDYLKARPLRLDGQDKPIALKRKK